MEECYVQLDGIEGSAPINVDMKGKKTLRLGDGYVQVDDVYVAPNARVCATSDVYEPTLLLSVRMLIKQCCVHVLFCDDAKSIMILKSTKHSPKVLAHSTAVEGNMYIVKPDQTVNSESSNTILKTKAKARAAPQSSCDGLNSHMHTKGRPDTKAEAFGKLVHKRIHSGKNAHVNDALKRAYGDAIVIYEGPCDPCMFTKARMHARNKHSRRKASRRGERIHYDLFVYHTRTADGIKYVLVIVDEYTGKIWVRGLKKKSQAFSKLLGVIKMIEKESRARVLELFSGDGEEGIEISCLRSDNAGENLSRLSREFCDRRGIKIETSVAYQQWQNGVAERNGGIVMKSANTLLYAGHLPDRDWFRCVQSACHIRNLLPNSKTKGEEFQTPWEKWEQQAVPLKELHAHLRVIGCLCYVCVPEGQREKEVRSPIKASSLGMLTKMLRAHLRRRTLFDLSLMALREQQHMRKSLSTKDSYLMLAFLVLARATALALLAGGEVRTEGEMWRPTLMTAIVTSRMVGVRVMALMTRMALMPYTSQTHLRWSFMTILTTMCMLRCKLSSKRRKPTCKKQGRPHARTSLME